VSKSWPKVKLGEVLRRSQETAEIKPGAEYREVTVKLWGKGVVQRGLVSGSEVSGSRRFAARAGQFILSRIDARNGAIGIVPPALNGAVVTNDFPVFDIDTGRIEPTFLGWLSKTPDFVELCKRASEGTTNRVRLQEARFLALEILVPALAEQRRIVARIEELATKIAEARSLRQKAAREAETLARASVERSYRDLGARVGYSRLMDACETITDGDHVTPRFSPTGVYFIFVGNVSTGHLHFHGSKRVSEEYFKSLRSQRVPKRGDVLYSSVGATLGVPTIVNTDEPFCFQRHIAILKPDHRKIKSRFLWHMLRSRTIFDRTWSSTTGTAQPTVPLRAIRELPIPLPSLAEQREGVAYLDRLQTNVDVLKKLQAQTAAELEALMPSILDKAFKGEL